MKFTADDLAKIETKKLANIIRKLNEGKTLTAREDRILAEAKLNGGAEQTSGLIASAASHANFAGSWAELAKNLGVSRRAIQDWRDPRKFPQLAGKWPTSRDDGRHDVTAWLQLMIDFGLKRADENEHPDDYGQGDRRSTRDWKNECQRLEFVRRQRAIDREDGTLLVANELEPDLGATFMAIQNRYSQLPERAAPRLVGFDDVYEIEDRLREDVDRDLRELNSAAFLDESLREILDSLPFDEETARLLGLVTFAGQDAKALMDLIERVTRATLCAIGRRAIAGSTSEQPTLPESPAAEVIDQPAATPPAQAKASRPAKAGKGCKPKPRRKRKRAAK
jgi:hypothetical protein